jgi:histidinol-phosphate phosphatase family protein
MSSIEASAADDRQTGAPKASNDAAVSFDVVVPSAGRRSLAALLEALEHGEGPLPEAVIVVDDRRAPAGALPLGELSPRLAARVEVVRGPGRGPAAARNAGWRRARAPWVAFLDDDVLPPAGWRERLACDLASLPATSAASQGRIVVPLPRDRRPTDWERNVAGLEGARWATADMAFRRSALERVDGFDERFGRAYREDADLALRLLDAGYELARGERQVTHPVRPADRAVSLRLQAGNADDVLMRALHGRGWRERAGAPRGRLRSHLATTAAGLAALALPSRAARLAAGALWVAGTAELAWRRIGPGPQTRDEVATMLWTSALMPPLASARWLGGHLRRGRLLRDAERAPRYGGSFPEAVLLDRDGTLIEDVPYNGDPALVRPVPGAREALERLRDAGLRLAVVSNQSGVGRGLIEREEVDAVNRRVEELLGPLGPWLVCPHAPDAGCDCRKPRPGLVLQAAEQLGVEPARCTVIGDIGADVEAARAAGARAVLVPTPRTLADEVAAAPAVADDLLGAVSLVLGSDRGRLAEGRAGRPCPETVR